MLTRVSIWFGNIDSNPHVYSLYSFDPNTERVFDDFKNDNSNHLKLLFCIDMLNEGIHLDNISGVVLLRPTISPIIFKQQIGRALNAGKNSSSVILDIVNNISNLYSIDDIQNEISDAINFYQYIGKNQYIINKKFQIIDETNDAKKLFNELDKVLSNSWDCMYAEAKCYYMKYGDLLPSQSYETENGYKLGQWVVAQRIAYKKGILNKDRIEKLEKIGMCWLTRFERLWEEGFQLAKEYYINNGHLNVPPNCYPKLASWLIRQRYRYRINQLTEEQYRRLTEIGMVWEFEDIWKQKYEEAKKYYETHGNLDIPADFITESGVNLGRWYRTVLNNYKNGALSNEKIKLLEAIGIQWTSIIERKWMKYYVYASDFFKLHGHLNVNLNYTTADGSNLGIWISGQRYAYRNHKLSKDKIELLEKIGMCWNRYKDRWKVGFLYAERYFIEHGEINIPINYITTDGFPLGVWISQQRNKYKKGKLSLEQIKLLEKLKIVWNPHNAFWNEGFKYAKEYYNKHGDLNIPGNYITEDNFKLGSWLANQRTRYKNGDLSPEQIFLLEEIKISWNPVENRWKLGYEYAKGYFRQNRHLNVPKNYITDDGFKLGNWIATQRKSYNSGKLEKQKIELLENIDMNWAPQEEKWCIGYEHAKQYLLHNKTNNDNRIPYSYISFDGFKLGEWFRSQERQYQNGKLKSDRFALLKQLGISFKK